MADEQKSKLRLEIAHVLFIDIVGYSKLRTNEQSAQMEKLREIVRGTEQYRTAEAEGKLLRLPTGDGGALAFRNNPEAPVLCAEEIANALKSHPEIRVRMGIHSGPVNEVTDLNEQANIAGAGINIAQRIMDCGDAGHILVSKHAAEDLEQYDQWQPYLHDLGECEGKHGERLRVVNLYNDEIGNSAVPTKCVRNAIPGTTSSAAAGKSPPLLDRGNGDRCVDHPWRGQTFHDTNHSHNGTARTCSRRSRKKASPSCRSRTSATTDRMLTLPTASRTKF